MTENGYKVFEIGRTGEYSITCVDSTFKSRRDAVRVCDLLNDKEKQIKDLKEDDLIFFQAVWDILMKYQDLFNREMANEVLDDLGIELPKWFE